MFLLSVRCCGGCLLIVSDPDETERQNTSTNKNIISPEKFPWNKSLNANEKKRKQTKSVKEIIKERRKNTETKWNEIKWWTSVQFKRKWLHKMTMNYFFDTLLFSFIKNAALALYSTPHRSHSSRDLLRFIHIHKAYFSYVSLWISFHPEVKICLFCISVWPLNVCLFRKKTLNLNTIQQIWFKLSEHKSQHFNICLQEFGVDFIIESMLLTLQTI